MLVSDILRVKGDQVHAIVPSATLATAAGIMAAANIGALVVEDAAGMLIGLVSERDVTAALAHHADRAHRLPVSAAMSADPTSTSADATVLAAMRLMTNRRARHLPVVERGRVIGVLSIGDVLKSRLDETTLENDILHDIARWPRAA